MKKLINGEIVDYTPEQEAAAIEDIAIFKAAAITEHISSYRKQRENGGLEVSGVLIQTDAISRSNILGAKELNAAIEWKTENGFVSLTAVEVSAIAVAVGQHVQKCFSAEYVVTAAHEGTPYTSISAVEAAFEAAYGS